MVEVHGATRSVARPRKDPGGEALDQRKQIVTSRSWVAMVEEWCKQQQGRAPTFSDAVRVLVERQIRAEKGDSAGGHGRD